MGGPVNCVLFLERGLEPISVQYPLIFDVGGSSSNRRRPEHEHEHEHEHGYHEFQLSEVFAESPLFAASFLFSTLNVDR